MRSSREAVASPSKRRSGFRADPLGSPGTALSSAASRLVSSIPAHRCCSSYTQATVGAQGLSQVIAHDRCAVETFGGNSQSAPPHIVSGSTRTQQLLLIRRSRVPPAAAIRRRSPQPSSLRNQLAYRALARFAPHDRTDLYLRACSRELIADTPVGADGKRTATAASDSTRPGRIA